MLHTRSPCTSSSLNHFLKSMILKQPLILSLTKHSTNHLNFRPHTTPSVQVTWASRQHDLSSSPPTQAATHRTTAPGPFSSSAWNWAGLLWYLAECSRTSGLAFDARPQCPPHWPGSHGWRRCCRTRWRPGVGVGSVGWRCCAWRSAAGWPQRTGSWGQRSVWWWFPRCAQLPLWQALKSTELLDSLWQRRCRHPEKGSDILQGYVKGNTKSMCNRFDTFAQIKHLC